MNVTTFLNTIIDDARNVRKEDPKKIDLSYDLYQVYMLPSSPVAKQATTLISVDHSLMTGFSRVVWGSNNFDESMINVTTYTGFSVCPPKTTSVPKEGYDIHWCNYEKYVGFREVYEFCTICDKKREAR